MTEHLLNSFLVVLSLLLCFVVNGGANFLDSPVFDGAGLEQMQDFHSKLSAEGKLAGEEESFFEEGEAL